MALRTVELQYIMLVTNINKKQCPITEQDKTRQKYHDGTTRRVGALRTWRTRRASARMRDGAAGARVATTDGATTGFDFEPVSQLFLLRLPRTRVGRRMMEIAMTSSTSTHSRSSRPNGSLSA